LSKSPRETHSLGDATFHSSTNTGSGIYTWVIPTDTVYGDELVADLFGFDAVEAKSGLPLMTYLDRMHPEDLPRVAKAIHDTMVAGTSYQESYRICRPDGSVVTVTAFGSCFRNPNNEPMHYSGILFPAETPCPRENELLSHLLAAYDIAEREERTELAEKIIDILADATEEDKPETPNIH
jgi:PAS domain-containing protein